MAPVREMADNGNNPVETPEVQLELPSQTGREILRAAKQRRIEQDIKSSKSKLSKDVNTVTKMLVAYQTDFPDDDITCELQLGEAADIIRVIERANLRWITVENELDDLKSYICESVTMSDTDTLKELDTVDAEMTKYEAKLVNVKKEKRDILTRCKDILTRSKNSNTSQNQSFDGKASLLEVDATLINGCHRSSETPSKLAKNPEEKSIRIKNIRNLLKLPWYITDEHIQTFENDSEPGTTDIISRLISEQEDDSDDEYPYETDSDTDPESDYDSDLDESSHEQYYDSDEESDYDSDLNVETHINPDIALSEDDSDLENYQWGIWMHEMGKVNVEIRSYAKSTDNIYGILKNNVETDITNKNSSDYQQIIKIVLTHHQKEVQREYIIPE